MTDVDTIASASRRLANEARQEILKMIHKARASHVGSALSVVDILSTLYSGAANISHINQKSPERDIIVVSKGHASAALYSILALKGFFPKDWLERYCGNGSELGGHVTHSNVPGVEFSTGSLGHGLPYGLGIQLSRKLSGVDGKTFVIMSDGECDEGTTWESALIANHHKIGRLVVIVDRNRLQSMGDTEDTLALEPFAQKWLSFGWKVFEIDGHDYQEIFESANLDYADTPICIIANTTKGKGVTFMEHSVLWHYKTPTEIELVQGLAELEHQKS